MKYNKSVSLVFLVTFSLLLLATVSPFYANAPNSLRLDSKPLAVAEEQETIDSFDNHPETRYNHTKDGADLRVSDSELSILTTNNDSSGSSQYFAHRGLEKSDAKVEARLKFESDNNQSEYSRDYLNDEWDFRNDTDVWLGASGASVSQSNGVLIASRSIIDTNWGISINFQENISNSVWNTIKIRYRATGDEQNDFTIRFVNSTGGDTKQVIVTNMSTDWVTTTIDLNAGTWDDGNYNSSSFVQIETMEFLVSSPTQSSNSFEVEFVQLFGDLDFFTQVNAELEDTINFDNSLEFFTQDGDVSDFDDGTVESWTDFFGSPTISNANNTFLNVSATGAGTSFTIERNSIVIPSATYAWLTFEYYLTNADVTAIDIRDSTNNLLCTEATTRTVALSPYLFSCDMDLDADWVGSESAIRIFVAFNQTLGNMLFNFTYVFSDELGGLEEFDSASDPTWLNKYVNPLNFLTASFNTSLKNDTERLETYSIDASLFDFIKVKANYLGGAIRLEIRASTTLSSDFNVIVPKNNWTLTTTATVFTFNLSANGNWTGTIDGLEFIVYDTDDSVFDGDEFIQLHSVHLLGHFNDAEPTYGLFDQFNFQPVLNITAHYFNEQDRVRLEVELLDVSGDVAFYYYHSNFSIDSFNDQWLTSEIDYDVLTSEMRVTIDWDNGTRIFRANYPEDFTSGSARTPALFIIGQSTDIYISTAGIYLSWNILTFDYINAPFKAREWEQISKPSDGDWIVDTFDTAIAQDDINDQSIWRIAVPFFDALSGKFQLFGDDPDRNLVNQFSRTKFIIYGVVPETGALTELFRMEWLIENDTEMGAFGTDLEVDVYVGGVQKLGDTQSYIGIPFEDNQIFSSFSCSTTDDRMAMNCDFAWQYLPEGGDFFQNETFSIPVGDLVTDFKQEFVLETQYTMFFTGNMEYSAKFLEFSFVERDLLGDFSNFAFDVIGQTGDFFGGVGGIVQTLLSPLFEFLARIIRFIADILTGTGFVLLFGFEVIMNAVQNAIVNQLVTLGANIGANLLALGVTIGAAITALESGLSPFLDGLEGLLGTISGILSGLAVGIWTAFISVVGDILGEFLDLLVTVWTAIAAAASATLDLFLDLLPFGIGAFVRSFNNLDIATPIAQFIDMAVWGLALIPLLLMLYLGFYMFFFPFVRNPDNPGAILSEVAHNTMSLHGFDFNTGLGNATIPIRVNAFFVWLFLVILFGYLTYLMPGTLF